MKSAGESAKYSTINFAVTYKDETYMSTELYVAGYVKENDKVCFADETFSPISYNTVSVTEATN